MPRTWSVNSSVSSYIEAIESGALGAIGTLIGMGGTTSWQANTVGIWYPNLAPSDQAALIALAQERRTTGQTYESYGYSGVPLSEIPLNPSLPANRVTVTIRVRRVGLSDGHITEYYCTCTQVGSVPDATSIGYCVDGCQSALDNISPRSDQSYEFEVEVTSIERGRFFGK